MKNPDEIIEKLRKSKEYLHKKYYVDMLALFGSYSRNEQTEESDIDILVETNKPLGFDFVNLALEIEDILNHKVDLVSKKTIKPKYFEEIKQDLRYV
jgi:predicted nucleotidyltransferase